MSDHDVGNHQHPRGRRRGVPGLGDLTGAIAGAAVRGVDINAAVGEVDLDGQLERVDVDRLLERVDVDSLLDRVDVNRLLEQVDVNRLLDRVDVDRLVERAGLEAIIARSTGQVAGGALDAVRRQVVAVDLIIMRVLYRLTGRAFDRLPAGPDALVGDVEDPVLRPSEVADAGEVVGRYAGLLPRLLALALDLALATGLLTLFTAFLGWILTGIFGLDVQGGAVSGALFGVALAVWSALYWVSTLSVGGRTPGMGLVGLRLLGTDGKPLPLLRVVVWTVMLPLSTVFGAGFLVALLGRRRQTLHDRVANASVVYDWGRHGSSSDTPLARWIEQHADD